MLMRERSIDHLPVISAQTGNLIPPYRGLHVPMPGNQICHFSVTGDAPTNWATPAREQDTVLNSDKIEISTLKSNFTSLYKQCKHT